MGSKVQAELGNAVGEFLRPERWTRPAPSEGLREGGAALRRDSRRLGSTANIYRLISSLEPGFFLPLWRTKFSRAESRERKLAGFWCAFSPYQKCARVLRSSVMVSSFLLEEGIREKRRKLTGCGSRILRWLKINLGLEAVYNYSSFFFFFKWLNYLVISDCLSLWYFGCSCPRMRTQNPKPCCDLFFRT